ncbi:hypothetical protein HGRIS_007255 [Hohenbuehelia grisea]|uniref:Uncharacterized protein n=1 Tax=Hohenbuehelia grisea TaxID=104357 RepID=A0ABR3JBM4_9AGAR
MQPEELPPLLARFPDLPPKTNNSAWSPQLENGVALIQSAYNRAHAALQQEADPVRLQMHAKTISNDSVSMLQDIEKEKHSQEIPGLWLAKAARALAFLIVHLERAMKTNRSLYYTGTRGRPRKFISREYLQAALDPLRNISFAELARSLNVDPKTLRLNMRLHGLEREYADRTDEDLNRIVRRYREVNPQSGVCCTPYRWHWTNDTPAHSPPTPGLPDESAECSLAL